MPTYEFSVWKNPESFMGVELTDENEEAFEEASDFHRFHGYVKAPSRQQALDKVLRRVGLSREDIQETRRGYADATSALDPMLEVELQRGGEYSGIMWLENLNPPKQLLRSGSPQEVDEAFGSVPNLLRYIELRGLK